MKLRTLLLLPIFIALAGCASQPSSWKSAQASVKAPGSRLYAWDGLGQDPNRQPLHRVASLRSGPEPDSNWEREVILAKLRPYSEAWWVVQDEIEAAREAKLAKRLVICQGCGASDSVMETTASLGKR